jgi:nitrogen fixation NifU-like protein
MSDEHAHDNPVVLDHFFNPRNVGDLADADGVGEVGVVAFGDVVRISIRVREGRIVEARFRTFGCGTSIATASMTTELIRGRTVEEALAFSNHEVSQALGGLPAAKSHCPVLAEEAVKAAVADYLLKRGKR